MLLRSSAILLLLYTCVRAKEKSSHKDAIVFKDQLCHDVRGRVGLCTEPKSCPYSHDAYDECSWKGQQCCSASAIGMMVRGSRPTVPKTQPISSLLPTNCGYSLNPKVIGGSDASLGQFPWMVRLGYQVTGRPFPQFLCGAVLISTRYVLTAAHCVADLPSAVKLSLVRLGEHKVSTDEDCEDGRCAPAVQDIGIEQIVSHADYDTPAYRHDIALIRLSERAKLNEVVESICLPVNEDLRNSAFDDNRFVVAGWGATGKSHGSDVLQYAWLPLGNQDNCARFYSKVTSLDPSAQLCAGGEEGRDSCKGDSGGPLMKPVVARGLPRYVLEGIVSFGLKMCGSHAIPAVYTNVHAYVPWILSHLQSS